MNKSPIEIINTYSAKLPKELADPTLDKGNKIVLMQYTLKAPVDEPQSMHFEIMLDTSGSMNDEDRLKNAKIAILDFIKSLKIGDTFNIMTFASSAKYLLRNCVKGTNDDRIQIALNQVNSSGETNFTAAFSSLEKSENSDIAQRRTTILFITDGEDTALSYKELMEIMVEEYSENYVPPIIPVAVGSAVNFEFLEKIASRTHTMLIKTGEHGILQPDDLEKLQLFQKPRSYNVVLQSAHEEYPIGSCYQDFLLNHVYLTNADDKQIIAKVGNDTCVYNFTDIESTLPILWYAHTLIQAQRNAIRSADTGATAQNNTRMVGGRAADSSATVCLGSDEQKLMLFNRKLMNVFKEQSQTLGNALDDFMDLYIKYSCLLYSNDKFAIYIKQLLKMQHDGLFRFQFIEAAKIIQTIANNDDSRLTLGFLEEFQQKLNDLSNRKSRDDVAINAIAKDYTEVFNAKATHLKTLIAEFISTNVTLSPEDELLKITVKIYKSFRDKLIEIGNALNNIKSSDINDPSVQQIIAQLEIDIEANKQFIELYERKTLRNDAQFNEGAVVLSGNDSGTTMLMTEALGRARSQQNRKMLNPVAVKLYHDNKINIANFIDDYFSGKVTAQDFADLKSRITESEHTVRGHTITCTIAHVAAEIGDIQFLQKLDKSALQLPSNNSRLAPIVFAGNLEVVRTMLDKEASLCHKDSKNIPVYCTLYKKFGLDFVKQLKLNELLMIRNDLATFSTPLFADARNKIQLELDLDKLIMDKSLDALNPVDTKLLVDFYKNSWINLSIFGKNKSDDICKIWNADTYVPDFDIKQKHVLFYGSEISISTVYALIQAKYAPENVVDFFKFLEEATFYCSNATRLELLRPIALEILKNDPEKQKSIDTLITQGHQIRKIAGQEMVIGEFEINDLMATDDKSDGTAAKEYYSAVAERLKDNLYKNTQMDIKTYTSWDPKTLGKAVVKVALPYISSVDASAEGLMRCIPFMNAAEQNQAKTFLAEIENKIGKYNASIVSFIDYKNSLAQPPENVAALKEIHNEINKLDSTKTLSLLDIFNILQKCTLNSSKSGLGNELSADEHWLLVSKKLLTTMWEQLLTPDRRKILTKSFEFCNFLKIITNDFTDVSNKKIYLDYATADNRLKIKAAIQCTDIAQKALRYALDNNQDMRNLLSSVKLDKQSLLKRFQYEEFSNPIMQNLAARQQEIDKNKLDATNFLESLVRRDIDKPHSSAYEMITRNGKYFLQMKRIIPEITPIVQLEPTEPTLDQKFKEELLIAIADYRKERCTRSEEYFGFSCFKGGYSKTQKLLAVDALLKLMEGDLNAWNNANAETGSISIKILSDSRTFGSGGIGDILNKIANKYKSCLKLSSVAGIVEHFKSIGSASEITSYP